MNSIRNLQEGIEPTISVDKPLVNVEQFIIDYLNLVLKGWKDNYHNTTALEIDGKHMRQVLLPKLHKNVILKYSYDPSYDDGFKYKLHNGSYCPLVSLEILKLKRGTQLTPYESIDEGAQGYTYYKSFNGYIVEIYDAMPKYGKIKVYELFD